MISKIYLILNLQIIYYNEKICYISSSSFPSQSANSIHVINMVKSISKNNKVEVFARCSKIFKNKKKLMKR